MNFSRLWVNFQNNLKRSIKVNHWPVGRNTCRSYFLTFFRLLPELSRQKALRKVEGRWMSGGHPFSADRIGKETCLR